jgi:hypothetical protein
VYLGADAAGERGQVELCRLGRGLVQYSAHVQFSFESWVWIGMNKQGSRRFMQPPTSLPLRSG